MVVTVAEKWESRDLLVSDKPAADLVFLVQGTDESITAATETLAVAPPTWNGLPLKSVSLHRIAEQAWEGKVHYDYEQKKDDGTSTFSFDTTGGSGKLLHSLETVHSYPEPGKAHAPDFKQLINVTDDGVDGVEIDIPVYNFQETHYVNATDVDGAYKSAIFNLTATVNSATFRGFAAGEVLFRGARGSTRKVDQYELTFMFAASPNKTGIKIGAIENIEKKGWEYIWVRYENRKDDVAKKTVKVPIAVYVEKVYEDGDFSSLGLG